MIPGSLNARQRATDLDALAGGEVVDVLVVGGGITGTGIALDAASRGLSVALIEAHDLAYGTSRWSSKLVHGGLRYLAKGEIALAHESAVERGIIMTRTAPHLTRPLPNVLPLYGSTSLGREAFVGAGFLAGDALRMGAGTRSSVLPRPRRISAAEALALAPGIDSNGLRGALLSFDGQLTDDARLVVSLARTAARHGARILTRLAAVDVRGDRVLARDDVSGGEVQLRARQVINAAGVWAGKLVPSVKLSPSRGSHLVLDAATADIGDSAVLVPVPGESNRFVFLLPQTGNRVYVGLTDEPQDEIEDVPTAPESDVDFLLRIASSVLRKDLTREDVLGTFAGLRPLIESVDGTGGRSADLSRKHAVLTAGNGTITVVGGKLTTYRRMAADAVGAAVEAAGLHAGPCRTDRLPLIGANPRDLLSTVDAPARMVARYGTEAPRVAALGELDPVFARPLYPGCDITAAEVAWAVRHEGALDVDDVLHRRTRLGLVDADATAARPAVEDLVSRARKGLDD